MTKLKDIKACVFDAYETLFDVHSCVGRHREGLGPDAVLENLERLPELLL